jgi:peptidoglycan hydrolase CwlO-like protein
MKKRFFLLILALLAVRANHAQIHLFLEEQEVAYDDSKLSAWVMPVMNNLEEALKDLDDFVKDRSDARMKKGGENIIIAEKVSLPAIATKRGDLIGYGYITDSYYAVAVIFRLGYDISLNSQDWPKEMENFHTYARQFMSYHYEHAYDRRVEEIDKEIKDVEKEKSQNEKQIDGNNKRIDNLNKRIEKETDETKLSQFNTEIATLQAEIQTLSANIPPLDARIQDLQERKDKLNTEAHTYLGTIGTL